MKKVLFILTILMAFRTSTIYAQQWSHKWDIGISSGISGGHFFRSSLGADLGLESKLSETFSATWGVGVIHLFEKDGVMILNNPSPVMPYNGFPLTAGLKASISNHVYVATKLGMAFSAQSDRYPDSFTWSPSVGFAFHNGLDLRLRYEEITRIKGSGNFGLRIGYGLPFDHKK